MGLNNKLMIKMSIIVFGFIFWCNIIEPIETYAYYIEDENNENIVDVKIDGYWLKFDMETGTILRYVSGAGTLKIPSEINGVTVKHIGDWAFSTTHSRVNDSFLGDVILPETIITIGDYAFFTASCNYMYIPSSVVSIGDSAFYISGIREVYYGGTQEQWNNINIDMSLVDEERGSIKILSGIWAIDVSSIGDLANIDLFNTKKYFNSEPPEVDYKWIELEGVEGGKVKIALLKQYNYEMQEYTTVSEYELVAIEDSVTKLNLPSHIDGIPITSIGTFALYNCANIIEFTFPSTVNGVGYHALSYLPNITDIIFANDVYYDDVNFLDDLLYGTNIRNATIFATENLNNYSHLLWPIDDNLKNIYISDTDEIRSTYRDELDRYISDIDISINFIEHDPNATIRGFKSWYEVDGIENGMIRFDLNTGTILDVDYSITKAVIPSEINGVKVTSIDDNAFYDCKELLEVVIPDSVTYIGNRAFYSCNKLLEVVIPNSVTYIGNIAFGSCYNLLEIVIPNSVTYLGDNAFSSCSNLSNAILPEGLTYLPRGLFNMTNIKTIILPDSITEINSAFFWTPLEEIYLPESVTHIDEYAFSENYSLKKINIPKNITSIPNGLFHFCSNLEELDIHDNITSVGDYAFFRCEKLNFSEFNFIKNITELGNWAFAGCKLLANIELPNTLNIIDEYTFAGSNLNSINIPKTVTEIKEGAFYGCENLESIYLPINLKLIETDVFGYCTNLKDVYYYGNEDDFNKIFIENNELTDLDMELFSEYGSIIWTLNMDVLNSYKVGEFYNKYFINATKHFNTYIMNLPDKNWFTPDLILTSKIQYDIANGLVLTSRSYILENQNKIKNYKDVLFI